MLVTCQRCSKNFERKLSAIGKKVFCSLSCRKEPLERICEGCKKPYMASIAHRKTSRFCSKSCAKSGERHHFYGKVGPTKGKSTWIKGLTKDTDKRVANMSIKVSQTHKKQFQEGVRSNKGTRNPNYGKTVSNRTPEQLERYSKAAILRVLKKQIPLGKHAKHGYLISRKTNKIMYYRSSLERRFMTILDNDPNVITYTYEPFSLKITTGKRYLPDFHVIRTNAIELIEIKPKFQLSHPSVLLKMQTAMIHCQEKGWTYRILGLEEIKQYEILFGINK